MPHHDILVIGTGSGNMVIDSGFDHLSVGIVEKRLVGGTCLNFGCIPSKMLAYTAEVVDTTEDSERFGVDAEVRRVRWQAVRDRVFGRTDDAEAQGRKGREESDNITLYTGHARFTAPKTVLVEGDDGDVEVTAERIVLAAGGRPSVPPPVAESGLPYETSDTVMRLDTPPAHLAILGGGYIAAELAHVFHSVGSRITIIESSDSLLGGPTDASLAAKFTEIVGERYDLRLGAELETLDGEPGSLRIGLADGSTIEADTLLVAVGRVPNSDRVDAVAGGLAVSDSGKVEVDDYGRTSVEGVFALGDISTPIPLKHVANREAEAVRHTLKHPEDPRAYDHELIPSAIFTEPQFGAVGRTEQQCRDDGLDYLVARQSYSDVAYGWAMQDTTGEALLLVDRGSRMLLGAHIMGPQAASLIEILVVAMKFGISADDLAHKPYWIHPALTEVVQNALENLEVPAASDSDTTDDTQDDADDKDAA